MKKNVYINIKIAFFILVALVAIVGKTAFSDSIKAQNNINEEVNIYFSWASKPRGNETFNLGQEIKIPVTYMDKFQRKEINFVFLDKNRNRLDLTKYRLSIKKTGIVGNSTSPSDHQKQGHVNLPILGTGSTDIYLENKNGDGTDTVKLLTLTIVPTPSLKTASGLPLKYDIPYYIFDTNLKGKKGGITYEAYSNSDRILYSHEPTNKGTPQKILGGASLAEVKWGDAVILQSTSSNWKGNRWENKGSNTQLGSDGGETYRISNEVGSLNREDTGAFGLAYVDSYFVPTGAFYFYLNYLNPPSDSSKKSWLGVGYRREFAINPQPQGDYYDRLFLHLASFQQDSFIAYETDYKEGYEGIKVTGNKITYKISQQYHEAKIRYILRVNGKYVSESYKGKTLYSSSRILDDGNVEITSTADIKQGDKITLEVVTNEPGYSTDKSAVLQTLDSIVY